jgi:DNA modification methylase
MATWSSVDSLGAERAMKEVAAELDRGADVRAEIEKPFLSRVRGDARAVSAAVDAADIVITSPPYWRKRDYGVTGQIGQEPSAQEYVVQILRCMEDWRRVLPSWGSIFLNIGDTYSDRSLAGVPSRLEVAARDAGWIVRNRIVWSKEAGMPDPAQNRLTSRYEYIYHFCSSQTYYYDMFGYAEKFGNGTNPGDVWRMSMRRDMSGHLAPFPDELVERIIYLACPSEVCTQCGQPRRRVVERTAELDPSRPQARRAMELAAEFRLTAEHIAAIQAVGISDAGKALRVQTGTGRNSAKVKRLAAEAKAVLGGYFREFTFSKKRTAGWTVCRCNAPFRPGIVLDPFMGTGTTLRVAAATDRSAVGVDLALLADSVSNAGRSSGGEIRPFD